MVVYFSSRGLAWRKLQNKNVSSRYCELLMFPSGAKQSKLHQIASSPPMADPRNDELPWEGRIGGLENAK
jgi:hypothetical protein